MENFIKNPNTIFLEVDSKSNIKNFEVIFKKVFSINSRNDVNIVEKISAENLLETAYKVVHFGWKKEAIPLTETKKTLVARVFGAIFGQ